MEYYKQFTGPESVSIVNALAEMGINSSYANRERIAAANGIADYSGTATQNLLLLSLLKSGKLIKPGTDAPAQPQNTAEPTKRGFGRKVLIGAIVLGAGIAAYKMFGDDEPKTVKKKSGKKKGEKSLKGVDDKNYEVQVRFPGSDGWESICTCHNKKDAQAEIERQRHIEDDGDCEYRIVNNRKGLNGVKCSYYTNESSGVSIASDNRKKFKQMLKDYAAKHPAAKVGGVAFMRHKNGNEEIMYGFSMRDGVVVFEPGIGNKKYLNGTESTYEKNIHEFNKILSRSGKSIAEAKRNAEAKGWKCVECEVNGHNALAAHKETTVCKVYYTFGHWHYLSVFNTKGTPKKSRKGLNGRMPGMKRYQIYTGAYNSDSFRIVAEYDNKKRFIKKLKELGYEKYCGKLKDDETEFLKHFGKYSIIIL